MEWLNSLSAKPTQQNTDEQSEFIAFVLQHNANKSALIVDLVVTKAKKLGGLSKGRKISLSSLRYNSSYYGYVTQEDKDIVKILSVLEVTSTGECALLDSLGAIAMSKLLHTGRLYWQSVEKSPLSTRKSAPLEFYVATNHARQLPTPSQC